MDSQIKLGAQWHTNQPHVSAGGERCRRRRVENSRFRPQSQQRLTYAPTRRPSLRSHNVELQHWSVARMTMGVLSLSDHQSQVILQRDGGLVGVRSRFPFDSAAMTRQCPGYKSAFDHIQDLTFTWNKEFTVILFSKFVSWITAHLSSSLNCFNLYCSAVFLSDSVIDNNDLIRRIFFIIRETKGVLHQWCCFKIMALSHLQQ